LAAGMAAEAMLAGREDRPPPRLKWSMGMDAPELHRLAEIVAGEDEAAQYAAITAAFDRARRLLRERWGAVLAIQRKLLLDGEADGNAVRLALLVYPKFGEEE